MSTSNGPPALVVGKSSFQFPSLSDVLEDISPQVPLTVTELFGAYFPQKATFSFC